MSGKWRPEAASLEDEKQREAQSSCLLKSQDISNFATLILPDTPPGLGDDLALCNDFLDFELDQFQVLTDQGDLNRDDARTVRVDLLEHDDLVALEIGVRAAEYEGKAYEVIVNSTR